MIFGMSLADVSIKVDALYESTEKFCSAYTTSRPYDVEVSLSPNDIFREHEMSNVKVSDEYIETLALCRKVSDKLLNYNALLFHSSAIAVDGKAYLFAAPSGTGKSTHARLWREMLGARAVMINDDKPLVRVFENEVRVYGSPWDGKHHMSANTSARIGGICFLAQSKTNSITRITASDAMPLIMAQIYCPSGIEATKGAIELVMRISQSVPMWRLMCNTDISAAETSYNAMHF